jgi:DNA-binding transcriptional LysR family regulator
MTALSEQAAGAVAAAYGEQGGELAIGASQTIAQYLLPALIAAFRKIHPKVRITAVTGNTDGMLEALVMGRIELALIEGPEQRKDLRIEPFMEDHMVLVVPPSHEWAGQEVTPAMIKNEPLLMREYGSGSRRVIEQALAAKGVKAKDTQISMEFDSTEALLSAAAVGLGVAFVSRWAVRNQLALGTLKLAYAKELKLSRWFSLAIASGPEPRGNVKAFRALLLSQRSI